MQVKTNAGYIFEQLTSLLKELTDDQYTQVLEIFSGASVGKHYRHIIEFFQCVSVSNQTDNICYDNRIRDVRIETDKLFAIALLNDLRNELAEINTTRQLTLIGDIGSGDAEATAYMGTTLFREFHYAVEHAIHHMAIIKMGLRQSFPSVIVPQEFGVAPSTLRYQQTVSATN